MPFRSPESEPSRERSSDDAVAERIAALEHGMQVLNARLSRLDTSIVALDRIQTELALGIARLTAEAERSLWGRIPMPRAVRVLRKRLRARGLWPGSSAGFYGRGGSDPMQLGRATAPASLRPFFQSLTPFESWIAANRPTTAMRAEVQDWVHSAPAQPRISIITPVYDTPEPLLREMVNSVLAQMYDNWELCIADDASQSIQTRHMLEELALRDPRIRITRLAQNGGISKATNAAAAMASGEVLLFLDHDDLLTTDCLAEVAAYYARNPEADIVYSDDDKIDDENRRFAPQFKPDWSPTLLLSYMYMSHVLTVRRELFQRLGGFRSAFDGSQDYDFALRATEIARHVGHIPRILYHWRATEGSTALSGAAKPSSFEAGRRAVQEALDRRSIPAIAFHPAWAAAASVGIFSLRFDDRGPGVTVVIPTYNQCGLLKDCVESLQATTYADYEVLIIDNGSDDPETLTYLADVAGRPAHRVVRIPQRTTGFSFAALMNEAVSHVTTDFVLFLNNDTKVIASNWLSQMMGYARQRGVGAVGARLYFADGTLQHGGIVHGYHEGLVGHAFRHAAPHDWGYMGFVRTAREYSAVTAACMLTPVTAFRALGGFDEENFAVAYNDVDYCYRLVKQGMTCVYCPDAELFHLEGKTRGYNDNPKEVVAFRNLYGNWNDAWYNPNLSLENERFEPRSRRLPTRTSRSLRVVAVSHNLRLEGAPNTLLDLLFGLKQAGLVDPLVLAPDTGPLRAVYEAQGIEVHLFKQPDLGTDVGGYEALVQALAATLKALQADVVIANTLTTYYAIDAAYRSGIGAIWCQHESEPWDTYFDHLRPKIRNRAYAAFGQAYRVTYVADATRNAWCPVQTRHNAQTIRHGVPPERLEDEVSRWTRQAARSSLGVAEDEILATVIGTVCRRKGQLEIVEAIERMSMDSARRLRILIAGALAEQDYAQMITERIASLCPELQDRVSLVGAVPDMTLYYAAADIFVCTSRVESAPRVIVEAMAFGLPIITTPVFGIPELVAQGTNAVFYEPGDAAGLARAMTELVLDQNRRAVLASHSPDVLHSRPGYAEMVAEYADLIRESALLKSLEQNEVHP